MYEVLCHLKHNIYAHLSFMSCCTNWQSKALAISGQVRAVLRGGIDVRVDRSVWHIVLDIQVMSTARVEDAMDTAYTFTGHQRTLSSSL